MWIKGIRVENVGPHKSLDVKLRLGSVGVFGSNGSGKSTLIDLVYSALTNDFGRFPAAKADLVNLAAEAKAPAYVEVDAEHNGVAFTVRRGLRGKNPHVLTFPDKEKDNTFTDARLIADELGKIGLDKRLLDFAVFKPQNQIYSFIDVIPSVRGKAYQVLNRTEDCETFYAVLGDALKAYGNVAAVVDNSDELTERAATLAAERDALKAEKATQEGNYLLPDHKTRAAEIVEADRRFLQQQEELERLKGEAKRLYADVLEPAQQKEAKLWQRVVDLEGQLREVEPAAQAARDFLQRWEQVQAYRKQRDRLDKEAAELEKLRDRVPPKPAAGEPTEAEIQGKRVVLSKLVAEQTAAEKRLTRLTQAGKKLDTCPTCGQDVPADTGAYAEAAAAVAALPAKIAALGTQIADKARLLHTYAERRSLLREWEVRKEAHDRAALALTAVAEPEGDLPEARATLAQLTDVTNQLKSAKAFHADADKAKAAAWAKYEANTDRRTELEAELADAKQDEARLKRAKDRLAEDRAARLAVATLDGRIAEYAARLRETKADLARVRERVKASYRARKLAEILERARDVVHRDGLPQRVAQANLHRMEADINAGLAHFGSPFWVEADEDLTFVAHKPGLPSHTAGLLSGGQKMVLAVAFWNAVASMYRQDIGMLVLDEPTANLDAANVPGLAEAMAAFTGSVRGKRQLIMVTHADALRPAFDQVISLG